MGIRRHHFPRENQLPLAARLSVTGGLVLATALVAAAGNVATAAQVSITVGAATSAVPSQVSMAISQSTVPVPLPPLATASLKRDLIRNALSAAGFTTTDDGPGGSTCSVSKLKAVDSVTLATGNSGSGSDRIVGPGTGSGVVGFQNTVYDPFDSTHQPATFTAGIVTDLGVLTAQVSSVDLNFQTQGPIICQALFQRLAPRAPQYGAQINYAGDRLEVYFDPAYSVSQGGVVFGTTSPSPGCSGTAEFPLVHRQVTLTVDAAQNLAPHGVTFSIPPFSAATLIGPLATASAKRDAIRAELQAQGRVVFDGPDTRSLTVVGLTPGDTASFAMGETAEALDTLAGPAATKGTIEFANTFDPVDYGGQPALFTAGIVTDLGVLSAQVSAQDLNFQTEGPIICRALFQRLTPRAPQYGAQINYAGDRLEVYFDPAYTVGKGGVIFGTTSPSGGSNGGVLFGACPSPSLRVNRPDGVTTLEWFPPDATPSIDAVSGSLTLLHGNGGNFSVSTSACLADDYPAASLPIPGPADTDPAWFVVRSAGCPGSGTYDDWGTGQVAPRDAGISASGQDCTP